MSVRRVVPDLKVADLAATEQFYEGVLGMRVVMDLGWAVTLASPAEHLAQVTLLTADATAPVVPELTVQVADVEQVYAVALARGLDIVHPLTLEPWGVRRFFVRDPDGRIVNVLQHE